MRDPIGYAGRLFEQYGPLATIVRGPANMMTPTGRAVLVATGAELNREILTQHDRFRMYALPGIHFPDDDALAAAERHGGRRGHATAERLQPVGRAAPTPASAASSSRAWSCSGP